MKRPLGLGWLILFLISCSLAAAPRRQTTAEAVNAALIRWPYLQQVTHNSAQIIWTTDVSGNPGLAYGTDSNAPQSVAIVSRQVGTPSGNYHEHKAALTQLKPGTWYYYEIFDGATNLTPFSRRWFRTTQANGDFTFMAFGDSGFGTPEQYQLRDRMYEHPFDIMLHTGDMAYPNGSYQEFEEYHFKVYRVLMSQRPFFPTIGNHEYLTDDGQPYRDVFHLPTTEGWNWDPRDPERYYSFDWGHAHFVSLDSEAPLRRISDAVDNDMADWLEADLAADQHAWKITTIHRPLYSSSPAHPETDVREKLAPLFEAHGVDLVLSGHNHNYERTHPIRDGARSTLRAGGVVYVVTGGGGNALYPVSGDWFTAARATQYHFVKAHVTPCVLVLTAINIDGAVIDRAVLDKCPHRYFFPYMPSS